MKAILLSGAAVLLTACSSTYKPVPNNQFCDLKSETVAIIENGKQVEKTFEVMKCNDNRVERLVHAQSGIAKDCGEYKYMINLKGRVQERRGYACQKYDGTYEIVPHPSLYQ